MKLNTPSLQEALSWVTAVEDQIKKILSESISHKRMVSRGKMKGGREVGEERREGGEVVETEGGYIVHVGKPTGYWYMLNFSDVVHFLRIHQRTQRNGRSTVWRETMFVLTATHQVSC